MSIPLPNKIVENVNENLPNLSLKFYKRADVYNDTTFSKTLSDKKPFFEDIINLSEKPAYKSAFTIRKNHLESIGISLELPTASRLVFGMGYEHPLENGFMFDWTTGLPIIPGSSLKGTARSAAEEIYGFGTKEEKMLLFGTDAPASVARIIEKVFGIEDKTGRKKPKAGDIVFFPAYPCLDDGQKFLELDIMTPHYHPYYSHPDEPEQYPPADWYSPVPLYFLTVPEGVKYCFRLAYRKNLKDIEYQPLLTAKKILTYALTESGVGAKTNVFYGYFKDV